MKKFTSCIRSKANGLALRARMALSNQRGDFYISDAVKIIIAVVLGALLLAALTLIFNDSHELSVRSSRTSLQIRKRGLLLPDDFTVHAILADFVLIVDILVDIHHFQALPSNDGLDHRIGQVCLGK